MDLARVIPELNGWCTVEKAEKLSAIVKEANAQLSVELGVFGGRSLVALAAGAQETGGIVHGIDPWAVDAALEGVVEMANINWWKTVDYDAVYAQAKRDVERLGLSSIVVLKRARSRDVVDDYTDGSIDVLHQDSNHSELVSLAEAISWAPKVRDGGLWVFDDIKWHEAGRPTTARAQGYLLAHGFRLAGEFDTWAIFQKTEGERSK